jgi:mono/diheme cytochrome c family protein
MLGPWGAVLPLPAARAQTADTTATEPAPAETSTATPATETSTAETPAAETPAAETPAAETPTAETPTAEAPTAEAPTAETPTAETAPAEAASVEAAPSGTPAGEAPAEGAPPVPGLQEESLPEAATPAETAPEAAPAPEGEAATEGPAAEAPAEPPKPPRDWSKVPNPVPADAESVERGRALYLGEALCAVCHGDKGDGFGPVWEQFSPVPNAFLDPKWQESFSDGQLMGVLQNGKFGTGMLAMVPDFITEAQAWDVINYVRTFSGKTTAAYERAKVEEAKREAERQKRIEGETP